jgi:uncharacterized Zn finger protein
MSWYNFRPRVSVAQRSAQAAREVIERRKAGKNIEPVKLPGRKIAEQFWGLAWCKNIESYLDFSYRLDRGRSYIVNGSVVDLKISTGTITALVWGSEMYEVKIDITKLDSKSWTNLQARCAGEIGSLIDLLKGKLSEAVMMQVTNLDDGLFPKPKEIKIRCSCPDYAGLCKHAAAAMYGVGHRLDTQPELLFTLRGVDHHELIEQALPKAPTKLKRSKPVIAESDLGDVFGLDLETGVTTTKVTTKPKAKKTVKATKAVAPRPKKVAKAK